MYMVYDTKTRRVAWHGLSMADAKRITLKVFVRYNRNFKIVPDKAHENYVL